MKRFLCITASLLIFLLLVGCFGKADMEKEREAFAEKSSEKVIIAVPGQLSYMKEETGFLKGVNMAVEEINDKKGVLGREIETVIKDDKAVFIDGMKIAQSLADRKDIAAVVGHTDSYITIPAANIYNDAGVIMLSPIVSDPGLTKQKYKYIFRNIVSDDEMGKQMAAYIHQKSLKRTVLFYVEDEYGRALANAFEDAAKKEGLDIVDRVTEFSSEAEFEKALNKWKALDYDSVFIADEMPHAGKFIRMLRKMGSQAALFSGDGLDLADLPVTLGRDAENLVVGTMFNTDGERDEQKKFIARFTKKYGGAPDVWAVQGYDSIKLLAYAIEKAGSTSPSKISDTLHGLKDWKGVLGDVGFDKNGEMTGLSIYKKTIKDGKFQYIK